MIIEKKIDPSPKVISFGLVETSEVCRCGHKLYEYYENRRSPRELKCWECGLTFRANGKIELSDANGLVRKVGMHELAI